MSELTGFNVENLINSTSMKGDEEMREPKVQELMGKLRKMQQGRAALEGELKEFKSSSDALRTELTTLQTEAYKLQGIHKEKEDLFRKLRFQCEESQNESARQLNQNKKSEELLEQFTCEIQEIKLKHRKQRMKFENQLHQLIEQHKNLHSVFTPERLPDEIEIAENTKSQLLSAEQLKLDQLRCLDEELNKHKEPGTVAV